MGLLGNYTVLNKSPLRFLAGSTASTETGMRASSQRNGSERCRFYIDQRTTAIKTWAEPSGNYPPASFTIIPQVGGYVSSRRESWATFTAAANGTMGLPAEGSASLEVTAANSARLPADDTPPARTASATISVTTNAPTGQLITSGTGSATLAVTANTPLLTASVNGIASATLAVTTNTPVLGAIADLIATSSISVTASNSARLPASDASPLRTASAAISVSASGVILPEDDTSPLRTASAVISVTGSLTSYAVGHMTGSALPYTELSPQTLAAEVWNISAADFMASGSMGEKMNGAGSAGNPWTEVIESGYTASEVLRLLAAVLAGKVSGAGTDTITFRDLADTKDRVVATTDSSGNRTAITRDVT